jgi:hypothetical protein
VDPGGERDRGVWASERVYRALTRAYPEEVRRRYAEEMVGYFGDLCQEEWHSRGAKGVASLWARTLPDLLFTALQERGTLFRRNAYLPLDPGTVARWGALCALLGGIMGVALRLIGSLLAALSILTGYYSYGSGPLVQLFTLSLFLGALSLSSLGLFGLYVAVVARSSGARPGLLAGAGAICSAAAAFLWLSIGGYAIASQLASGSALFAPFEWLWNTGSFVIPKAILCWFLGLLLLGIAAARQPLPSSLRILPLALFALMVPSYLLRDYDFNTVIGNPVIAGIVMVFGQSLPFVGIASLGWVLLKDYDADEPLAVSGGPVESAGAARGMARSASWPAGRAWGARSDASAAEATREKELLEAIRRHGEITAAEAAMETSLSVEEADRMLSGLAVRGHLEVTVDGARITYSLWEGRG